MYILKEACKNNFCSSCPIHLNKKRRKSPNPRNDFELQLFSDVIGNTRKISEALMVAKRQESSPPRKKHLFGKKAPS
jgi:hypothetical protein